MCAAHLLPWDVCSSLVAHIAAVEATRARIPTSCQILSIKPLDGVRDPGNIKKSFKKLIRKGRLRNFAHVAKTKPILILYLFANGKISRPKSLL